MKSYEQIAAAMYAAWEKKICSFHKLPSGLPWSDLSEAEQAAWVAAAKQAAAELALVH